MIHSGPTTVTSKSSAVVARARRCAAGIMRPIRRRPRLKRISSPERSEREDVLFRNSGPDSTFGESLFQGVALTFFRRLDDWRFALGAQALVKGFQRMVVFDLHNPVARRCVHRNVARRSEFRGAIEFGSLPPSSAFPQNGASSRFSQAVICGCRPIVGDLHRRSSKRKNLMLRRASRSSELRSRIGDEPLKAAPCK